MEATGHYNDNLLYFLQSHSYTVTIFNPLATNLYRKAMTLRKTKTDKIDALVIAKMLLSNYEGNQTENNDRIKDLKACTRFRQRLNGKITKEKIHFSILIEIVFPELSESVWSTNQKSVYELLKQYPNVRDLSRAHLTTLTNCLLKGSNGKYGQEKAIEIRNKTKNSIGKVSKYLDIELLSIIKTIEHFQDEIRIIDSEIKNLMLEINSPLLSIPEISYRLGSVILAEIGDIDNFKNPSKLLAFCGLDPSIYESGNYSGEGRMVKRGSKYLRWP